MVPQKRYYDAGYCRAPRRKKKIVVGSAKKLLAGITRIFKKSHLDVMAVVDKKLFKNVQGVHPEYHLPDVSSLICLGIAGEKEINRNTEMQTAVSWRHLQYTEFQIAHYLDIMGYSAVSATRIPNNPIAEKVGIYQSETNFITVLTSASLASGISYRKKAADQLTPSKLRSFYQKEGADLAGFFDKKRYDEFCRGLSEHSVFPNTVEDVEDKSFLYCSPLPQVRKKELTIKPLDAYVPNACSVIVLGLHYPHSSLDTAKVTPAETSGPYSFVQYETLRLLHDMGFGIIRRLRDSGYHGVLTNDLTDISSTVKSSWDMLPDMRANRFAALLAGLGYLGLPGYPITPEFGTRQRFIAIVTDFPLSSDPLYDGKIECEKCDAPCMLTCPTKAVSGTAEKVTIENKTFSIPHINYAACDWVKKYCLSNTVTDYLGMKEKISIPKKKDGCAVAKAMQQINWGVQKRHLYLSEDCLRVCPLKGSRK